MTGPGKHPILAKAAGIAVGSVAMFYLGNRLGGYFSGAWARSGSHLVGFADALNGFLPSLAADPLMLYLNAAGIAGGVAGAALILCVAFLASGLGGGFYAAGEEHGTARVEGPKTLAPYADKDGAKVVNGITYDNNMILSAHVRKRFDGRAPKREFDKASNVFVASESGGGKTREYVIPNIMQLFGSLVIADTKGGLYKMFAGFLQRAGYVVRVLNLTNGMRYSEGFNFLAPAYIEALEDIPEVIDTFIEATNGEDRKKEWFDSAEGALLKALTTYLYETQGSRGIEFSLADIIDLLDLVSFDEATGIRPFDVLLEKLNEAQPGNMTRAHYKGFSAFADSPKTTASILGSVHVRLQNAKTPGARRALGKDEMHLDRITKERTAVFVVIEDQDPRPYKFVNGLFYSTLLRVVSRQAQESDDERVDIPLHILIDETRGAGKIPALVSAIGTMRSKGVSMTTVWQNYGQAVELYGKEGAQTIFQNSPTKIFLGGDDPETNELFSKTFGEGTVRKKSQTVSKGSKSDSSSTSAQSLARRPVMPDELGRMRPPDMYVKVAGFNVVKDTRYDFERHPNYRFTAYATGEVARLKDVSPPNDRGGGETPKRWESTIAGIDKTKTMLIQGIEWRAEQKGK